jgi:glycogen debranching enzyme
MRPNYLIALTVAPQMVNKKNAWKSLQQCRLHLMNEDNMIGIKTLESSDWNYEGNYDNSNCSSDGKISRGFNYHNGFYFYCLLLFF